MTETSRAEVPSDGAEAAPDDTDLGSRQTAEEDEEPDTVLVVVAYDTPPDRVMPQPVVREVPREVAADWDERYWSPLQ